MGLGTVDPEELAQLGREKELKLWRDQHKTSEHKFHLCVYFLN
jgi:hypothetical protein